VPWLTASVATRSLRTRPVLATPTAGKGRARSDAAPGLTEGAAMADELDRDRKLARHRGALLARSSTWPTKE
jgi:hypothetical protein